MTLPAPDKVPSKATLKKYGLSLDEWIKMYWKYGGRCHVCLRKQSPKATRTLHVDHEHIPNWKKLPPEKRKLYIRGLSCYTCNRFRLTKGTTRKTAKNLYRYLKSYEKNHKCKSDSVTRIYSKEAYKDVDAPQTDPKNPK